MNKTLKLTLPWPPSVNGYWRAVKGRQILAKKGREYKKQVALSVISQGGKKWLPGRLNVAVDLYPPDKRRRDVDNFGGKALLDALGNAGVYNDDSQIDELHIVRREIVKGGMVRVVIEQV